MHPNILTSFLSPNPDRRKSSDGRKYIGYFYFVSCKVLPKLCFCNLIKICWNSIYKRQRLNIASPPELTLPSCWRVYICRDREKCNFALYNLQGKLQAHKTFLCHHKIVEFLFTDTGSQKIGINLVWHYNGLIRISVMEEANHFSLQRNIWVKNW